MPGKLDRQHGALPRLTASPPQKTGFLMTSSPVPPGLTAGPGPHPVLRMSALDLQPVPGEVPRARQHARAIAAAWGLAAIAGDAELIVSELITNAIVHGTAAAAGLPPVRLRLTRLPRGIQVGVWDAADEMPQARRDPLAEEPGGRGLVLVAAIASRWGACRAPGGGKWVYAVIGA
jgi:anti-sigma regulatory factor (Ser/Thr protein kinase)